jgi:ADP-heptose:LPS heptosyltransferase
VVLSTVSHSLTSDLLALWSRARLVAGSAGRVFPGASRNFLYHLEAAVLPGARHQSERNLDIVRTLGCDTADLTEEIRVPEDELSAARAALASTAGRRIGFHLGAGKLANRWPAERFARLASLLAADGPTRVVLFWGPAESELRDEYERHADGAAEYAGPMPVTRLAAWFGSCDVMVCNDTGVMHLAAAAGVPTVALFGPTDPQEWTPRGDRVRALRGSGGSVAAIGVEEVASCVRALLAAYPPPAR